MPMRTFTRMAACPQNVTSLTRMDAQIRNINDPENRVGRRETLVVPRKHDRLQHSSYYIDTDYPRAKTKIAMETCGISPYGAKR